MKGVKKSIFGGSIFLLFILVLISLFGGPAKSSLPKNQPSTAHESANPATTDPTKSTSPEPHPSEENDIEEDDITAGMYINEKSKGLIIIASCISFLLLIIFYNKNSTPQADLGSKGPSSASRQQKNSMAHHSNPKKKTPKKTIQDVENALKKFSEEAKKELEEEYNGSQIIAKGRSDGLTGTKETNRSKISCLNTDVAGEIDKLFHELARKIPQTNCVVQRPFTNRLENRRIVLNPSFNGRFFMEINNQINGLNKKGWLKKENETVKTLKKIIQEINKGERSVVSELSDGNWDVSKLKNEYFSSGKIANKNPIIKGWYMVEASEYRGLFFQQKSTIVKLYAILCVCKGKCWEDSFSTNLDFLYAISMLHLVHAQDFVNLLNIVTQEVNPKR